MIKINNKKIWKYKEFIEIFYKENYREKLPRDNEGRNFLDMIHNEDEALKAIFKKLKGCDINDIIENVYYETPELIMKFSSLDFQDIDTTYDELKNSYPTIWHRPFDDFIKYEIYWENTEDFEKFKNGKLYDICKESEVIKAIYNKEMEKGDKLYQKLKKYMEISINGSYYFIYMDDKNLTALYYSKFYCTMGMYI